MLNLDNKILNFLSALFDGLLIAALWLISCIPLLTIGAATTAALSAMLGLPGKTGSAVLRFFYGFRNNWRQATLAWLILLLLGGILALDIYACWWSGLSGVLVQLLQGTTIFFAVVYIGLLSVLFGVIAKFHVTLGQAFQNAAILSFRHLPTAAALFCLTLLEILSILYLLVLSILPVSLFLYLQGRLLQRVFSKYDLRGGTEPNDGIKQA